MSSEGRFWAVCLIPYLHAISVIYPHWHSCYRYCPILLWLNFDHHHHHHVHSCWKGLMGSSYNPHHTCIIISSSSSPWCSHFLSKGFDGIACETPFRPRHHRLLPSSDTTSWTLPWPALINLKKMCSKYFLVHWGMDTEYFPSKACFYWINPNKILYL